MRGVKNHWKEPLTHRGLFSKTHFPFGAAPGGQPGFAQALQQTLPPCRSKQSHFYYFSPRNSVVIWQPHTLDKPRTNSAPTYTGTTPLSSGTVRVVPLQLGRKIFSKLFTELEKKLKFSPDPSLTNQHSTQGKAQLEAVGQLRIRSFLQQDFAHSTSDASGRINTNLAFYQLVLSVPHSVFSRYFHCGQFELFRTENERSFPKPSCDMCTNLLGRAPGGTGHFWGFLGISMLWEHTCVQQRRIPSPRTEEWSGIRTEVPTHTRTQHML